MNKVRLFNNNTEFGLERDINEFAENHEIINVSFMYNSQTTFIPYKALVLYKWK